MTEEVGTTCNLVVEREFAHPPEKIWRALTKPHLIADWLMKNDFEPTVGHRFKLSSEWGSVQCEVVEVEPYRKLAYRWNSDYDDPAYAVRSVVTFKLIPTDAGTFLSMEQRGFTPEQKEALEGSRYGWTQHFDSLEKVLLEA